MADTVSEIVNMALTEIGDTAFIDDIDEETEEARVAKSVYLHCLKRTLESADRWPFATKRKKLEPLADVEFTNWDYAYLLPADYVKLQGMVIRGAEVPELEIRSQFTIETRADGRKVLLTLYSEAEIKYTWLNQIPGTYPTLFTEAFVTLLAAKLARGLKKDATLAKDLEVTFYVKVAEASASEKNQADTQNLEPRTPSLRARGGS